jgi:hypothetical protein
MGSLLKESLLVPLRLVFFVILYLSVYHPVALGWLLVYFAFLYVLFKTIRKYRL